MAHCAPCPESVSLLGALQWEELLLEHHALGCLLCSLPWKSVGMCIPPRLLEGRTPQGQGDGQEIPPEMDSEGKAGKGRTAVILSWREVLGSHFKSRGTGEPLFLMTP